MLIVNTTTWSTANPPVASTTLTNEKLTEALSKLKGEYFDILVKEGERVAAGDTLIRFDREKIKARGFDVTTPMIVSNADEYDLEIAARGEVAVGTPLLRLKRKERIG